MATGRIDIWVTTAGDPCRISEVGVDSPGPWVVAIWDCCGRLLTWCGKRYVGLPTKCGHIEVEVPPGTYVIRAAEGMNVQADGSVTGNYWTDHAVAYVCCGEETCVTLVAPSTHQCGFGWLYAVEALMKAGKIDRGLAENALQAGHALLAQLPQSAFERATRETLLELAAAAEGGRHKRE